MVELFVPANDFNPPFTRRSAPRVVNTRPSVFKVEPAVRVARPPNSTVEPAATLI